MSAEAEASVLGCLMADNDAYWRVVDRLRAEDFAFGGNRRLFELIGQQVKAGLPADFVTLMDLDESLAVYAADLGRHSGYTGNAVAYADIVRKAAEGRRLREAGNRIAECADYEDALNLLALVRPAQAAKLKTVKDGLREMVEALQRRYDVDGPVSGVPTGIASLDALTSGWQKGNLIVLAARPGMGKSAFALQAAIAAGRSLFVSLEMTVGELIERAVSNVGALDAEGRPVRVPYRWIRFPVDAPDHAGALVNEAARRVAQLPLLIDDSTGLSVDAICSRARQAHMQAPLNLVIVDHLGLVDRPGKHDPSELGAITAQLKRLAKDLGIPVLLLCQLNRGLEARPDKRPQLSDLRDSGRIEEDADLVIALYRDEYYHPQGSLVGYVEIIVRKARSGELGTAWARSLLSVMQLESCNEPERSVEPASSHNRNAGFQARSFAGRKPQAVSGVGRDA